MLTTNTIIGKRNVKFPGTGRYVSPDENNIFKSDGQPGSVEICDTGWGTVKITPEELEQQIEGTETNIEAIKRDIERLGLEINELKCKNMKKCV